MKGLKYNLPRLVEPIRTNYRIKKNKENFREFRKRKLDFLEEPKYKKLFLRKEPLITQGTYYKII